MKLKLFLGENSWKSSWHWVWQRFVRDDTKITGHKSKNRHVGQHQTKKSLYSKGNKQQCEKTTYIMGESVRKSYISWGAHAQNIQRTSITQ